MSNQGLYVPEAFVANTYNYVICGGGTAGLTLAARLTEDPSVTVAVIEAGHDHTTDPLVTTWGLTSGMLGDPEYDWIYRTEPQVNDNNRIIAWPRGKQLGGSSAVNLEVWNHASQADINNWGELGNAGWSWAELLPYFLKSETYHPPPAEEVTDLSLQYIDPAFHGTNGPIQVAFPTVYNNFSKAWTGTFKNLGIAVNGDPFGGKAVGGFNTPICQDPKSVARSYAANAYYTPNAGRANLQVLTGALVNNVVFDVDHKNKPPKSGLVATGANFTFGGKSYVVKADIEVILSAGVVQSPQLLELSGIGDKNLLKSLGIDVLIDNPNVGENLQDHQITSLGFEVVDGQRTLDSLGDFGTPNFFPNQLEEFNLHKTGLLAEAATSVSYLSYEQLLKSGKVASRLPSDRSAYAPTAAQLRKNPGLAKQYKLITKKLQDPHEASVQQIFLPAGNNYNFCNDTKKLFTSPGPGHFLTIYSLAVHPYSRGHIHIKSADPTAYPVIDPKYLSSDLDLRVLETAALQMHAIGQTEPLASLLKAKGKAYETGYEELNDGNVKAHVKKTLNTLYHGIGTCAMEPREFGGVVDERLKVYGTANLRVVDASIAPMITRGTIQSFVYAIAEKAADMIKHDSPKNCAVPYEPKNGNNYQRHLDRLHDEACPRKVSKKVLKPDGRTAMYMLRGGRKDS